MKYLFIIFILIFALRSNAQSLEFSTGIDWLYLPTFENGKYWGPETYALKYDQPIRKGPLSIGFKVRYSLYPGNNYNELGGSKRLHNYGPGDDKYFTDLDYERGIINYGRYTQRWNYHSFSFAVIPQYKILRYTDFSLDIFISGYVDRYFTSEAFLFVTNAEIKAPSGNTATFDEAFFLNAGFISLGNGGGLKLNYDLSDYVFIALDGEFMYFYQGYAYFYSNISLGYKF